MLKYIMKVHMNYTVSKNENVDIENQQHAKRYDKMIMRRL